MCWNTITRFQFKVGLEKQWISGFVYFLHFFWKLHCIGTLIINHTSHPHYLLHYIDSCYDIAELKIIHVSLSRKSSFLPRMTSDQATEGIAQTHIAQNFFSVPQTGKSDLFWNPSIVTSLFVCLIKIRFYIFSPEIHQLWCTLEWISILLWNEIFITINQIFANRYFDNRKRVFSHKIHKLGGDRPNSFSAVFCTLPKGIHQQKIAVDLFSPIWTKGVF